MELVLFFLIEFLSTKISINIVKSNSYNIIFQFFDKGKKVDPEVLTEFEKILNEKEKVSKIKKVGTLLLLIPLINILYAKFEGIMMKRDIRKYLERNNGLSEMTKEERDNYKKLKDIDSKLAYIILISHSSKSPKLNVSKNKIIINKNQLLRLRCDRLIPLAYTLNDIKYLNDYTDGKYIVGRIKECNVAIVGCEKEVDCNSLIINNLDKKSIYQFNKYSEEEAKDKTFIVYPFNEEIEYNVQKGVDHIIQERFDKQKESKTPKKLQYKIKSFDK